MFKSNSQTSDPRLYVALDVPSIDEARNLVDLLDDTVISYKIGLQLLPLGGAELGRELSAAGKNVFLDFKLHDIDATVEKATRSISTLGANLLTVHARPDIMQAAIKGRDGSLKILGVTVLTSLDDPALIDIGYHHTAEELVVHRVQQAMKARIDGIVCSPLEARKIRSMVPEDFLVLTPGVRMTNHETGDQKRIATPKMALNAGASHIVVGRPITQAKNPRDAAKHILENMRQP